jgi:inner membrane transporter RhtA
VIDSFAAPTRRRAAEGAGFVLLGAIAIQYSATLAVGAFRSLAPSATSGWRFLLGAVALLAVARPALWRFTRDQWVSAAVLGLDVALMNLCFYQAIHRIPLGSAVAIEFLGPICVAALGTRSWRHGVGVIFAVAGVVALTRPGSGVHVAGALFAAGAGLGWAAYTVAAHRVGRSTTRLDGLAAAMVIAAAATLPFSMGSLHVVAATPSLAGRLAATALLAIVLGFGCELAALRRLRPAVVAVLLALDPAIAFVVGWLALSQHPTVAEGLAVALVLVAGVIVTADASSRVATAIGDPHN